jgi:hypothetical protein
MTAKEQPVILTLLVAQAAIAAAPSLLGAPVVVTPHQGRVGDLATGDVNADGSPDIVVSVGVDDVWYEGDRAFGLELSLSDGAGGFDHVVVPTTLYSGYTLTIDVADLDGDGDADVVAGHSGGLSLFLSDGDTLATQVDRAGPRVGAVALGDLDADGDVDMLTLDDAGDLGVWHNGGAGAFSLVQSVQTAGGDVEDYEWDSIEVVDLDDDGVVDVLLNLADQFEAGPLHALMGDGAGLLDESTIYASGVDLPMGVNAYSVDVGDVDGDGRADLVFVSGWAEVLSMSFDGGFGGVSAWPTVSYGFGWVTSGDVDGDGDVDVVGTTGFEVGVLLQDAGALVDIGVEYELTGTTGWASANDPMELVDMNGDGCADLVTHVFEQGATILPATGPSCAGAAPATWGGEPASPGEDVGDAGSDKHDKALPMSGDADAVGCSAIGGGAVEPGLLALSALVLVRRRRADRG